MGMNHSMMPVGSRPLHPHESIIIAAATDNGMWVRHCLCGLVIAGKHEADLWGHFLEHVAAANEAVAE